MAIRSSIGSSSTGVGRDTFSGDPSVSSRTSKSGLLQDYLTGSFLSSDQFNQWLSDNHSNLNDYYRSQLLNAYNQYASQHFEPTFLQGLESFFGFNAAEQNFENMRWTTLNDSIADILQGAYKESFQDPAAEIARRRAAGINDDLSGGSSVGSGEPGDIKTPENASPAINDGSSSLQDVVTGFINVFSSVMSLAGEFQGLSLGSSQIASAELSANVSARDMLLQQLADSFPADFFTGSWETDNINEAFSKHVRDFLSNFNEDTFNAFSPRTRKYLKTAVSGLMKSNGLGSKVLYEELYNKYLNARQANVNIRGDYRFSEDFSKWISNSTEYISTHLKNVLSSVSLDVDIKGSEKELAKYRVDKIKSIDGLISGVAGLIPKDATWRGFAEMMLELFRLTLTQKLFNM